MKTIAAAALLVAFASLADAQTPPAPPNPLVGVADPVAYQHALDLAEEAAAARNDDAAEPLLENATAAYALDPRIWSLLGDVKRRLNKPAEAIAAYERAIAIAGPRYRFVREWIAELYMQTGDHDAAIRTLEKLVFENSYLQRPGLMNAEVFAPLREDPRFQRVAGVVDTSQMSREQGWRTDLDFLLGEIRRLDPRYHHGEELPAPLMAVYRDLYTRLRDSFRAVHAVGP